MIDVADFKQFLTIKQTLDDSSIRLALSRYSVFNKYLVSSCQNINKQIVESFLFSLKNQKLKPNSINAYIFMLKHLWAYSVDRKLPHESFVDGLKILPHPGPPIEILSQTEIESLINVTVPYGKFRKYKREEVTDSLNNLYKIFTMFLSRTGARFSEAADLKCKYLDVGQGKVTFDDTKNGTYRSVWFTQPLMSLLKEITKDKKREDLVFENFLGSPIIPQNYALHVRRAAKITNITKKVHPHIFRHSFATQLYIATKDIGLVQIVLGHKDIKSTMIYIHLADEAVRKGIYRHPYNRSHVPPEEFIRYVEETIDDYRLEDMPQFEYPKVKAAIATFVSGLHSAIKNTTPIAVVLFAFSKRLYF